MCFSSLIELTTHRSSIPTVITYFPKSDIDCTCEVWASVPENISAKPVDVSQDAIDPSELAVIKRLLSVLNLAQVIWSLCPCIESFGGARDFDPGGTSNIWIEPLKDTAATLLPTHVQPSWRIINSYKLIYYEGKNLLGLLPI